MSGQEPQQPQNGSSEPPAFGSSPYRLDEAAMADRQRQDDRRNREDDRQRHQAVRRKFWTRRRHLLTFLMFAAFWIWLSVIVRSAP